MTLPDKEQDNSSTGADKSKMSSSTAARPTFAGSGFFAATQDPSQHFSQLPMETPFFTPQATWTEMSRGDYFPAATPGLVGASAPSSALGGHIHPSQANLFASGLSVPAQTPAAIEIPSFSASSPSYFPTSGGSDQEPQGFQLPPISSAGSLQGGLAINRNGMSRPNLSLSMPISSLMSPPSAGAGTGITGHRLSMSSLSQSHHSPVAATAVPADLNIQEIKCETVSGLLAQVLSAAMNGTNGTSHGVNGTSNGSSTGNAIMVLDMRPSAQFAMSTIKTAINVCVPNMFLKRPQYSIQMIADHLTTEEDTIFLSGWRQFGTIVFLDAGGSLPVGGSPTALMAQKFRKEGCSATLAYLHGGFSAFLAQFGHQCRTDGSGSAGSSSARLHLGSLPSLPPTGPLGCQTPMIENPNVNPLFESVRQAMGLSTNITEEIPVRLPMGFSVHTMQDHLPKWLLSAIAEGSGKSRLAEFFQKVEISENKRLALLMLPQNMRSGRTTNFSIGAGIEQGLKNRYNNIWPYDHTRVKLLQVEAGQDDYINASFLTPMLSKKTYIATQGPLPSTFQDFWKTAWQQNSRVVVMLTREQEMGRIKCHEYWPSPRAPTLELGPLQVVFVNEFLPDPTIGTILVRQLKLRYLGQPEEERNITQIQYTGWPDFGVPETPLEVLRVVQLANEHNIPLASAGPMIVHCSAGCGRTGAFCVIDSILSELQDRPDLVMHPNSQAIAQAQAAAASASVANSKPKLSLSSKPSIEFSSSRNERVVNAMANAGNGTSPTLSSVPTTSVGSGPISGDDILSDIVYTSVSTFREQRISMVQTLRQYVFCYEAIYWHLARVYAKERPALGLDVLPPPSMAVHTPLLPLPPGSNPHLSMGNAPLTTTQQEFSFFG